MSKRTGELVSRESPGEESSNSDGTSFLPIQILDLDTGDPVRGGIIFRIKRESFVGDITRRLQEMYPGYFIRLRNQLLKLRGEQTIAEVMDAEDVLTAFIQKEEVEEEEDSEDFFVVIQNPLSKRRLFLTPGDLSKLDLHKLPYSQQIAVCRLVRVGQNHFLKFTSSGKTVGRCWRERL